MIVSPDGKILKELKKNEGVITTIIEARLPKLLRLKIPSLKGD
jgi:predicted amidohydrolase